MPRFEPFPGIRYDPAVVDLREVIAPPYDVIDAEARDALEARSPHNAVRVELARDEPGRDRHQAAAAVFDEWLAKGVLVADPEPAFYVYRMGYRDEAGRPRQTSGVIGALELSLPGEGDVLPHERTMPRPLGDRLGVLRACRANLSPVWVLSLADGLTALCEPAGPPDARATDEGGIHHRLWRVSRPAVAEAITAAVAAAPAVIADGHHRYGTALAYQAERRAAGGGRPGDYDLLMAYVVELADEQLSVRPIHRLVAGLPAGKELPGALEPFFEVQPAPPGATDDPAGLAAAMAGAGALGLLLPGGAWLLRPCAGTPDAAGDPPDAALLDPALAALAPARLAYEADPARVAAAVAGGHADAGFLLRPPAVAQIAAYSRAGRLMPEKTTFFHPKPRTGLVFRRLRD